MIIRFSRWLLALLFCIVLLPNPTAFADVKTPATIVVLGDSLSAAYGIDRQDGWVSLLQQRLQKRGYSYKVVNASVSGDTTRTGLGRLAPAIETHRPEIVIVALGGNDGLRGLPFTEIESSLSRIITTCKEKNVDVLLIGVRLPPNYGPAYNQQFAQLYQRLAKRYNVPLVPQMLNQVADYRELMQEDGMHPTARAQPQIVDNVWRKLKPLLKKP